MQNWAKIFFYLVTHVSPGNRNWNHLGTERIQTQIVEVQGKPADHSAQVRHPDNTT